MTTSELVMMSFGGFVLIACMIGAVICLLGVMTASDDTIQMTLRRAMRVDSYFIIAGTVGFTVSLAICILHA